LIKIEQ